MTQITITGIDEKTDLERIASLATPAVEVGVLYTATPEGRNRYPRLDWIVEALRTLNGRVQCAIHVCGRTAREQLQNGALQHLIPYVKRIQVNGALTTADAMNCANEGYTLITQHCPANAHLLNEVAGVRHAALVDASGGRGISPDIWVRPPTDKAIGFAGGLGPENIRIELPQILRVAAGDWWIDMEGKLRSPDDWFDVHRAEDVVAAFGEMMRAQSVGKAADI